MSKNSSQRNSQIFKNRNKTSELPLSVPNKQLNDIYLSSHMDNLKNNLLNMASSKTKKVEKIEKTTIDEDKKEIISTNLRIPDSDKNNQKNIFLNSNQNILDKNIISDKIIPKILPDKIISDQTIKMKKKKTIIINRDEEKRNQIIEKSDEKSDSENIFNHNSNSKIDQNQKSELNNKSDNQNQEYFNYSLQNLDKRYGKQIYDQSQNLSGNDRDESQNLEKDHSYFTDYIYDKNKDVMKNNISEKIIKNELNKSDILKKKIREDYVMFETKINEKDIMIRNLSNELENLNENSVSFEDYNLLLEDNAQKKNFITLLQNKITYLEKNKIENNSPKPQNQNIEYYILLLSKKNEKIKALIKDNETLKKKNVNIDEYKHLIHQKIPENKIKTINDIRYTSTKEYRPQYYNYVNEEKQNENIFIQNTRPMKQRVSTRITRISPEIEVRRDRNYEEREKNRRYPMKKVTRYSISKSPSKGYKSFPFKNQYCEVRY